MSNQQRQQGYLRQAWLVIVLAFAYGGALAGVHTALAPRIEQNKRQETYDVIPDLVPGADKERTEELLIQATDGKLQRVYKTHDSEGNHNGWVLSAAGTGFADRIELLVGVDAELSTLTGLYVLDQKETPGLGDYITQADFRDRFRGKPVTPPLEAVQSDPSSSHEVLAVTGATISSWSVCTIVNKAIAQLREPILSQNSSSGS
ncbi:MAG: FMN-binding protein [Planctomycetes bacterium]|nr:FMN-binding protein [Planctomycetota bacterium]